MIITYKTEYQFDRLIFLVYINNYLPPPSPKFMRLCNGASFLEEI